MANLLPVVQLGPISVGVVLFLLMLFGGSLQQRIYAQDPRQIHPEEVLKTEGAVKPMCPMCQGVKHGKEGSEDYYKRQYALPMLVEPWLFAPLLLGMLLLILAMLFGKKREKNESIST
jgi:hypothetical protein